MAGVACWGPHVPGGGRVKLSVEGLLTGRNGRTDPDATSSSVGETRSGDEGASWLAGPGVPDNLCAEKNDSSFGLKALDGCGTAASGVGRPPTFPKLLSLARCATDPRSVSRGRVLPRPAPFQEDWQSLPACSLKQNQHTCRLAHPSMQERFWL